MHAFESSEFKTQVLKPAHQHLGGHLSPWTLEGKKREHKVFYTKNQNHKGKIPGNCPETAPQFWDELGLKWFFTELHKQLLPLPVCSLGLVCLQTPSQVVLVLLPPD